MDSKKRIHPRDGVLTRKCVDNITRQSLMFGIQVPPNFPMPRHVDSDIETESILHFVATNNTQWY